METLTALIAICDEARRLTDLQCNVGRTFRRFFERNFPRDRFTLSFQGPLLCSPARFALYVESLGNALNVALDYLSMRATDVAVFSFGSLNVDLATRTATIELELLERPESLADYRRVCDQLADIRPSALRAYLDPSAETLRAIEQAFNESMDADIAGTGANALVVAEELLAGTRQVSGDMSFTGISLAALVSPSVAAALAVMDEEYGRRLTLEVPESECEEAFA